MVTHFSQRTDIADVFFLTPLKRTDLARNLAGWTQDDLHDSIVNIIVGASCPRFHIVDLYQQPITRFDGLLQDGLHPTVKGMKMIASRVSICLHATDSTFTVLPE